jgi:hypothetical protein
MIYLFSYIRNDNLISPCYEHGFYNSIDKKFYGIIEYKNIEDTHYIMVDNKPTVCEKFNFVLPKTLNLLKRNGHDIIENVHFIFSTN